MDHENKRKIVFAISFSCLIIFWVAITCTAVAVSGATTYKFQEGSDESLAALICNASHVGVSLIILLSVTLPACIGKSYKNCCTPTYYISVVVAGSISVIGTSVAGILLIFAVHNYKNILSDSELSSYGRAAASLNLISAIIGVVVIVTALLLAVLGTNICKGSKCTCEITNSCFCCKEDSKCTGESITALILVTFLLISILVAALLTMFSSFLIVAYSSDAPGDSANYERASVATFFSIGAAACLLLGFCVGGPFVCCYGGRYKSNVICAIMCTWALLASGTVIGGGLMIKVGQSFSSEEMLNPDIPLNRAPISAMGYFVGGLNFLPTAIAISLCCVGAVFKNRRSTSTDYTTSDTLAIIVVEVV